MIALILAALAAPQPASASAAPPARTPGAIVAAAPARDWIAIAPDDLLVLDLAPDRLGRPRRVTIQLVPPPFATGWVDNIRALARAHWWDGTSVNRVQDNYVVQWGDATERKPLPAGLRTMTSRDYVVPTPPAYLAQRRAAIAARAAASPARPAPAFPDDRDPYARSVGFVAGFPVAETVRGGASVVAPAHCYGMVGVGRNLSPDTGSGAELYAVIGQAPRHLDRNIALVGRVVEGIEHLSSLPRGTGDLGFYVTAPERTAIVRVRLASDLAPGERPHFDYLATDSASFAAYAEARANRRDAFFDVPAGGVDVCNVPVPVRGGAGTN